VGDLLPNEDAPLADASGTYIAAERVGDRACWAAAGSEDTEVDVMMEPEVGHGATKVYPRVQTWSAALGMCRPRAIWWCISLCCATG
jgi:hypothetical protein